MSDRKEKNRASKNCIVCGKLFYMHPDRGPKGFAKIKSCSQKCAGVAKSKTDSLKFWEKVNIPDSLDGCWLWTAYIYDFGYGLFHATERKTVAHKWSYELMKGPVPDRLELDHLCRVRHCVNPDHLEAVTHLENVRRGDAGKNMSIKTHCPQGHPYSGDNLRISIRQHGKSRICRTCQRDSTARFKERRRNETVKK